MDKKGQGLMERLILIIPFIFFLYVALVVLDTVYTDLLFPLLGNFEYGSIARVIFDVVPLLLVVMLIIFVLKGDGGMEQQPRQVVYQ